MNNIFIIYTDPYLSYSPSTLNLYEALALSFNVRIVTFEPEASYSTQRITDKQVTYLPVPKAEGGTPLLKRLSKEIRKSIKQQAVANDQLFTAKARYLIEQIKQLDGELIAVDFFALWCVQQAGKQAHLFSLELYDQDIYKDNCNAEEIKSVIIQTEERYRFLFPSGSHKLFLIQNAPNFTEIVVEPEKRNPHQLVFCGSAIPAFGFISCLEFISDYPAYTLTVKGAVPEATANIIYAHFQHLIEANRLVIDKTYLTSHELNLFISKFYAGFVFYDLYRFDYINRFNYLTAPSGKLFQYYNAGVPVIGNQLPGLESVSKYNAGVLINNLSSNSILQAITQLKESYVTYSSNAVKAAIDFDFTKSVTPFLKFMQQQF